MGATTLSAGPDIGEDGNHFALMVEPTICLTLPLWRSMHGRKTVGRILQSHEFAVMELFVMRAWTIVCTPLVVLVEGKCEFRPLLAQVARKASKVPATVPRHPLCLPIPKIL